MNIFVSCTALNISKYSMRAPRSRTRLLTLSLFVDPSLWLLSSFAYYSLVLAPNACLIALTASALCCVAPPLTTSAATTGAESWRRGGWGQAEVEAMPERVVVVAGAASTVARLVLLWSLLLWLVDCPLPATAKKYTQNLEIKWKNNPCILRNV